MSVRRLDPVQPESFKFNAANACAGPKAQIKKYPQGQAGDPPLFRLLWRAQEQHDGWLPEPAIRYVAEMLDMAQIRVLEVATFYTMFNLSPVGKYFVQLCGTTPCMLRGAEEIKEVCRRVIRSQQTVDRGRVVFLARSRMSGAHAQTRRWCRSTRTYYEDLDGGEFRTTTHGLEAEGKEVKPGPQNGRQFSCPEGGPTTLLNGAETQSKSPAKKPAARRKPRGKGASK